MIKDIDEAIKHAEEVAEENQAIVDSCDYYGGNMAKCEKCAEEHRQLAEWLKELKRLKEQEPCGDAISRAEAQTEIEMNACRYTLAKERDGMGQVEWSDQLIKVSDTVDIIRNLPSVKPLEQEPILDKIRAEIEDLDVFYDNDYFSSNTDAMFKRNEVLAIIDKYKESEE